MDEVNTYAFEGGDTEESTKAEIAKRNQALQKLSEKNQETQQKAAEAQQQAYEDAVTAEREALEENPALRTGNPVGAPELDEAKDASK